MIPIYINNFNRVSTTKRLVEDLQRLGYQDITILDNVSTYPPLLSWYDTNPCRVVRLERNMQSYALWDCGELEKHRDTLWVAYTDSDIELNYRTPYLFIDWLVLYAEKYNHSKAGLALKIDDLPDNPYANHYRNWEQKFWSNELEPNVYDAQVDTTFCVLKPTAPNQYRALRIGGDFTAIHRPWYSNFSNLDEEEQYYLDHAENYSTYKRFYLENIKNQ